MVVELDVGVVCFVTSKANLSRKEGDRPKIDEEIENVREVTSPEASCEGER